MNERQRLSERVIFHIIAMFCANEAGLFIEHLRNVALIEKDANGPLPETDRCSASTFALLGSSAPG